MPAPDEEPGHVPKLLLHFIDEMSWPMLFALGLVAFFFFYGVANSLIKLTGREVSSIDFPAGPVVGALSSMLLVLACAVLKLRSRH